MPKEKKKVVEVDKEPEPIIAQNGEPVPAATVDAPAVAVATKEVTVTDTSNEDTTHSVTPVTEVISFDVHMVDSFSSIIRHGFLPKYRLGYWYTDSIIDDFDTVEGFEDAVIALARRLASRFRGVLANLKTEDLRLGTVEHWKTIVVPGTLGFNIKEWMECNWPEADLLAKRQTWLNNVQEVKPDTSSAPLAKYRERAAFIGLKIEADMIRLAEKEMMRYLIPTARKWNMLKAFDTRSKKLANIPYHNKSIDFFVFSSSSADLGYRTISR
jgi:hypothetical protein